MPKSTNNIKTDNLRQIQHAWAANAADEIDFLRSALRLIASNFDGAGGVVWSQEEDRNIAKNALGGNEVTSFMKSAQEDDEERARLRRELEMREQDANYLRTDNARLADDLRRLQDTVKFQEDQYLKSHDGSWGKCKYQIENEELRKAATEVNDRYIGGSSVSGQLGEAIEKLAALIIR